MILGVYTVLSPFKLQTARRRHNGSYYVAFNLYKRGKDDVSLDKFAATVSIVPRGIGGAGTRTYAKARKKMAIQVGIPLLNRNVEVYIILYVYLLFPPIRFSLWPSSRTCILKYRVSLLVYAQRSLFHCVECIRARRTHVGVCQMWVPLLQKGVKHSRRDSLDHAARCIVAVHSRINMLLQIYKRT